MLKCEINGTKCSIIMRGSLTDFCSELSIIMSHIVKELDKHNLGKDFKLVFTKGFMDGVAFGEDRKTMEGYLKTADERFKHADEKFKRDIDFLKDLRDLLSDMTDDEIKELERRLPELEERLRKGNKK